MSSSIFSSSTPAENEDSSAFLDAHHQQNPSADQFLRICCKSMKNRKKHADINTADAKKSSEMFAAKGIKEKVLTEAEKNKSRVVMEVEVVLVIACAKIKSNLSRSWRSYARTEELSCFEVLKNNSNGAETGSLLHLMKEATSDAQLRVLESLWIHTLDKELTFVQLARYGQKEMKAWLPFHEASRQVVGSESKIAQVFLEVRCGDDTITSESKEDFAMFNLEIMKETVDLVNKRLA
ncbi:hypothetical protein C5167_021022 [Papaver somniferum]|uniref:Uncharacterized protein n=1 Tax=Papaver somniferum TaxID=3469 RepID=A0A4Y7IUR1_PAPSO|nr:hypothetical protein C5167_021022 [Papaver somniferum]